MESPVQKIRDRFEARRIRRRLSDDHRQYADEITSSLWREYGDIGQAHALTGVIVMRDAPSRRLDPETVALIIQLALLIYKTLKRLNVMSPSTEMVTALFEGE